MVKILTPLTPRFWSKVNKGSSCWTWIGGKTATGYGCFYLNGKLRLAHRVSWEAAYGKIPPRLTIDHLCRNPSCVRPDHLEVVTIRENIRRGNGWSARNARKTHCPQGHPLISSNLSIPDLPGRKCLTCRRDYDRRRYQVRRKNPAWVKHMRQLGLRWYYAHLKHCRNRNSETARRWRIAHPDKNRANSLRHYYKHRADILKKKKALYKSMHPTPPQTPVRPSRSLPRTIL